MSNAITKTANPELVAQWALSLARHHLGNGAPMASSAELCYQDARELQDCGAHDLAAKNALRSLSYSVGILHEDHRRVADAIAQGLTQ